eukprot:m.83286 g.83286  ORF g.83286 m.83286 type:complete len:358 (-) comp16340_c0_seq50:3142-4215(-)
MEHFGNIKVLKNDPEAERLLQDAARQVVPIMAKRNWRVGVLEEFCPANPGLLGLNVNRGQRIKIRMRSSASATTFLPSNDILGTLLHELVHIVHGPHSAEFYKMLDSLWDEYEAQVYGGTGAAGITGVSGPAQAPPLSTFTGSGHRLHAGKHNPASTPALRRHAAMVAAQKRAAQPIGTARKLGGTPTAGQRHLSVRELAARAAIRRQKDDVWCGACGESDQIAKNDGAAPSRESGATGTSTSSSAMSTRINPSHSGEVKTTVRSIDTSTGSRIRGRATSDAGATKHKRNRTEATTAVGVAVVVIDSDTESPRKDTRADLGSNIINASSYKSTKSAPQIDPKETSDKVIVIDDSDGE